MSSPIQNAASLIAVLSPELEKLCRAAPSYGELILRATIADGDIGRIVLGIETSRKLQPRGERWGRSMTESPILEQALSLLAEGFSVIPCLPKDKKPAIRWMEYQSHRPDEETVREWFTGTDYNLAIICGAISGGLVVLDFDDEGLYTKWRGENTYADGAPVVRSSRGYHVYLRADQPIEVHKIKGLDIQGEGHYVLAPPSIHPSGTRYELIKGDFRSIPLLPEACFVSLTQDSQKAEKASDSGPADGLPEGTRNATLFSLGCRLRNAGESPEEVLAHLHEANGRDCKPLLEDSEIIQISASVERYRETEERLRTELLGLTLFQFGAQKDSLAARYKIDKTTLSKLYTKEHAAAQVGQAVGKSQVTATDDPEPLDEPVDGDDLLDEIKRMVRRFVVLDDDATTTTALWIALTYLVKEASYLGILALESATKRCGKTTLLAVLRRLVRRPRLTSNITSAALFRIISASRPTLLIDEADTFMKLDEALRGILNAGTEPGGTVTRCVEVGGDFEPHEFDVYGPKAIAIIGKLAPTIEDRSFVIHMRRKTKDEEVERHRGDRDLGFEMLRRKIMTWTSSIAPGIAGTEPEVPSSLNDRAADRWRDLLRIADAAGGVWPERARRAAETLEVDREDDDDESKTLLLEDIRAIFERQPEQIKWHSKDLVGELTGLEGRPWSEWKNGKPLSTYSLAHLLNAFGVKSRQVKHGGVNRQGYRVEDFTDVFSRYLAGEASSSTFSPNASPCQEISGSGEIPVGDANSYLDPDTTAENETKIFPDKEIVFDSTEVEDRKKTGAKNNSLQRRMRISFERRNEANED